MNDLEQLRWKLLTKTLKGVLDYHASLIMVAVSLGNIVFLLAVGFPELASFSTLCRIINVISAPLIVAYCYYLHQPGRIFSVLPFLGHKPIDVGELAEIEELAPNGFALEQLRKIEKRYGAVRARHLVELLEFARSKAGSA
jgi:hypothetical protein